MKILSLGVILFHLLCLPVESTLVSKEGLGEEKPRIHIVAPSYGDEVTLGYVKQAQKFLEGNGFVAIAPDNMIKLRPLGDANTDESLGYANTNEYRQTHLWDLLFDEACSFIWGIRGGRGASEIVSAVEELSTLSRPKIFLGFSDITALHLLAAKWGWPSLHCPVLAYNRDIATVVNGETALSQVLDILSGKTHEVRYTLTPLNEIASTFTESIEAPIVGGNASLVQRSIGTATHLETKGKVLFLEDIGEPATKFLEMMTHFRRAQLFKEVRAILLGDFESGLIEAQRSELAIARKAFCKSMDTLKIPVLGSNTFGHGKINNPLPFGTPATFVFQGTGEVTLTVKMTGYFSESKKSK